MTQMSFQRPKYLECDYESLTANYGKFTAQPFERGFAVTVGNALRRILLSSIPARPSLPSASRGSCTNSPRSPGSSRTSRTSCST